MNASRHSYRLLLLLGLSVLAVSGLGAGCLLSQPRSPEVFPTATSRIPAAAEKVAATTGVPPGTNGQVIDVSPVEGDANQGRQVVVRIELDAGQPAPLPGQRVRVILEPIVP
jgi:hypothetical protein